MGGRMPPGPIIMGPIGPPMGGRIPAKKVKISLVFLNHVIKQFNFFFLKYKYFSFW